MPKEQVALSNFSDITDRNTQNLIKLFESLKNDEGTFDQQEDVCKKIIKVENIEIDK